MTITIKHLDGPLAGTEQTFDDNSDTIVFGRSVEEAQVVYPAECDYIGRKHFQLKRSPAGDYHVELFGKRYVAIDGEPAENGMAVKSGSTFRLGRKDGPSFDVDIPKLGATKEYAVTAENAEMTTAAQRFGKRSAIGIGVLAAALIAFFGYSYYVNEQHKKALAALADDLKVAAENASKAAKTDFSDPMIEKLQNAVYLVARKDGDAEKAEGTAWAFAPGLLATNAHVTNAINGREREFFLVGPDGKHIKIKNVISHPGYDDFKSYKTTQGTQQWDKFVALDLVNEYDVGIIEIDPATPLPVDKDTGEPITLDPASEDYVQNLAPGTPVASFGFPVEGLAGGQTATKAPGKLRFGHISALTDVFMCRAEPEHLLLIQHSVPVTGGASGSPLIDKSGKVIGIVNGGNTAVFRDPGAAVNAKTRLPNAALINFAQRIDMLQDLFEGDVEEELADDKVYWKLASQQFDQFFNVAKDRFVKEVKALYAVADAKETWTESETLDPGAADYPKLASRTYTMEALPGRIYGFIADTESGVPLGINIKKAGTKQYLRDAKDPRKTSEPAPAPTAWLRVTEPMDIEVVVWGFLTGPAKYKLHTFEWDATPATTAGAAASESQQ